MVTTIFWPLLGIRKRGERKSVRPVISNGGPSKFHVRQRHIGIYVCRDADRSPVFCIGCTCPVGLAGIVNGVTTQKEVRGQTLSDSKAKD